MKRSSGILTFTLALAMMSTMACQFSASTANLSSLKLSKDKGGAPETTDFAGADTIYAVATVANAPGKVKVKGSLVAEDVPGQTAGPIPGLETTLDFPGSGTATFNFSPPQGGWPKGKYKVDVVMLDENGQQKDQKSASFNVS